MVLSLISSMSKYFVKMEIEMTFKKILVFLETIFAMYPRIIMFDPVNHDNQQSDIHMHDLIFPVPTVEYFKYS